MEVKSAGFWFCSIFVLFCKEALGKVRVRGGGKLGMLLSVKEGAEAYFPVMG